MFENPKGFDLGDGDWERGSIYRVWEKVRGGGGRGVVMTYL